MESEIIKNVLYYLKAINNDGIDINGTKEIQNAFFIIERNKLLNKSPESEEELIQEFYDNYIGNWTDRIKLEADHYKFLESFIIHKIGEVRYFMPKEDLTSRKFVIWSNDCIASIQFLHRPGVKNYLNVFIRSSDALRLLPADLLAMWKILDNILVRFKLEKFDNDEVTYFISSCHYYNKDQEIVNELI